MSNQLLGLCRSTLIVGVPLTVLGIVLAWVSHPGGGLVVIVALVPSLLLKTRGIVAEEYFWWIFPFAQFAYYFVWTSLVFGVRSLFKAKPDAI